ncbi:MAG TPA: precorrin-8X methylmutase [Acidimicrobiales bacterium]|nr:precorrin-8X methylmutase [Acidimicrobiales bacterium]
MSGPIHPIEARSYRIMEAELGDRLAVWPDRERAVVARMVHATADDSFATSARIGPEAVSAAIDAMRAGAAVICDARMVAAGIPAVAAAMTVSCYLDSAVATEGLTRSAAAVDAAAADHPEGALWVFGNAPTALARLLELSRQGVRPAAVIGLPVGYVGAAEAKDQLWASELAPVAITNQGRRGGSAVAAAAVNALWRLAQSG